MHKKKIKKSNSVATVFVFGAKKKKKPEASTLLSRDYPTDFFSTLEPQDHGIGDF